MLLLIVRKLMRVIVNESLGGTRRHHYNHERLKFEYYFLISGKCTNVFYQEKTWVFNGVKYLQDIFYLWDQIPEDCFGPFLIWLHRILKRKL